ncbi:hypothetical protein [Shewanella psychrotolerans]|uniref:hypothetical protein n=1 Tax=Shewanella psychrotolerans TaxID=2864206 RepID=UPI001C660250|nr:hypothetical protein [Shewanella psychrotolerans]QYK00984.1 hypothetical protein K0I62_16615 [Shewanella psychrotolerans]
MKGYERLSNILETVIGLGVVISLIMMLLMLSQYMDGGWIYVSLESFQGIDIGLWRIVLTGVVSFMMLLWITLAFSFVAVVSAMCVLFAMIMMVTGFSPLWPLLLLLLAAWGIGKASQLD